MENRARLGIWHTTTLQSAQEKTAQQQQQQQHTLHNSRQVSYGLNTLASRKRNISESIPQQEVLQGNNAVKRRAGPFLLPEPTEPPRLTASVIEYADGNAGSAEPSEYSQRRAFPSTPTSTVDPLLSLSHRAYGLPDKLVTNFASLGIKSIYPWQKHCLLGPKLLQGEKNLVYSAPTGGGKSLVADILMLRRVLESREAKAILVLPYVALVQEKVRWLRSVVDGISRERDLDQKKPEGQKLWAQRADSDSVRVVGFFGGSKVKASWADFDLAVCTIEKVSNDLLSCPWHI